jgi:ParB family chromosome partitioning protein
MKTALGKGLKALIPDTTEGVQEIPLDRIMPNPKQPRRVFEESTLEELANSIREKGVLQPVIVKKAEDDKYILVAGERRLRAARLAGLTSIPAIVKDTTEAEAVEIALIENIQRDDLNPLEMAEAFQRLINEFNYTQEQLATRIGKDRATVANYLRILKLPPDIKEHILSGQISLGHAKAILSLPTKASQIEAAREVIRKGLSVRQTERLCKALSTKPPRTSRKEKDPNIVALEERLKRSLGTKVTLKHRGKKGKIEIEYYSLDELDRLIELLTG